jgi:hypothetical protein
MYVVLSFPEPFSPGLSILQHRLRRGHSLYGRSEKSKSIPDASTLDLVSFEAWDGFPAKYVIWVC